MDDMERYGDYNEVDEPPKKSLFLKILKIIVGLVCLIVGGVLVFRIILFNYYPSSMESPYVDEELLTLLDENGGSITARTQKMRYGYDDAEKGNFFCDHLIVIDELGRLQITLRYNKSLIDTLEKKYGSFDEDAEGALSFVLYRNDPDMTDDEYLFLDRAIVGEIESVERKQMFMYTYYKIVIDGIDFSGEGDELIEWLSLAIFVEDHEEAFSRILVYENNDKYSSFEDYPIVKEEIDDN